MCYRRIAFLYILPAVEAMLEITVQGVACYVQGQIFIGQTTPWAQ